jgi:hypothetical protein
LKIVALVLLVVLSNFSFAQSEVDCTKFNYNPRNIYPICENGEELFQEQMNKSLEENKVSVVVFGYSACPWCQSLHKIFFKEFRDEFISSCPEASNLNYGEIPVGFYHQPPNKGYKFQKLNGLNIIQNISADLNVKVAGYPSILVTNPKNGKNVILDTGILEDNSNGEGHSFNLLCNALKKSAQEVLK